MNRFPHLFRYVWFSFNIPCTHGYCCIATGSGSKSGWFWNNLFSRDKDLKEIHFTEMSTRAQRLYVPCTAFQHSDMLRVKGFWIIFENDLRIRRKNLWDTYVSVFRCKLAEPFNLLFSFRISADVEEKSCQFSCRSTPNSCWASSRLMQARSLILQQRKKEN